MPDTTQANSHGALTDLSDRYEALVRDFGLLRQLEDLPTEGLSVDDICTRFVGMIARDGAAENCSIMLLDRDGSYLVLRAVATRYASRGFTIDADIWRGKRFALCEGVAGHVAATGTAMRVDDTLGNSTFIALPDSPVNPRSLMCFPLAYRGQPIGVLNLSHGEPCYFDVDREKAMDVIAKRLGNLVGPLLIREEGEEKREDLSAGGATEVLLVLDLDGNVLQISDNCTELTGVPAARWISGDVSWRACILQSDRIAYDGYYANLLREPANTGVSYSFAAANGYERRLNEFAMPLQIVEGAVTGYLAVVQDEMTRQVLSRWSSNDAASKLLHAQRLHTMGQLAGGIVHDLNNLLTAVVGNLDLALVTDSDSRISDLLARARKASLRSAEIVASVLRFGRAGATLGDSEPVEIRHLLAESAGILRCSLDPQIELEIGDPNGSCMVIGDVGQLNQVLVNLGVNARDALEAMFSKKHDAPFRIRIGAENVRLDSEVRGPWGDAIHGDFVRLYVSDNGAGMSPEVLARIYEPFFTTKPTGKGTGLGLPTVSRIVRHHRGWMTVDSTPGQGTTVNIYLPACAAPKSGAPSDSTRPNVLEKTEAGECVMLVDDENLVRNLGVAILKRLGYRAIGASCGREAIALFREHQDEIALVILDLQMPDMGGETVFKTLRGYAPDLPVIYSTGRLGADSANWPEDTAPTGFLNKPYLIATMAEVIREALEARKSLDAS